MSSGTAPADDLDIPRPALVVLVGPSGSGKSTWARGRFASSEVVSSDGLRAVVGTGEGDLDASVDAFALLDAVVAARLRRRLTTVVDTLGLEPVRRAAAVASARTAGVPAVAVLITAPPAVCRARNRLRDRPVPAPALTAQLRRAAALDLSEEGFDLVIAVDGAAGTQNADAAAVAGAAPAEPVRTERDTALRFVLQISSFPWGTDPRGWLTAVARAAEDVGFAGVAVMDHLLQIPQVGRAWDPLPEAYVTLGFLAGVTERLRLGTLVTPVTFRSAPLLAKIVATLDAVSGGRAFLGVGAGWYAREHAAYGLPFPRPGARLDLVEDAIATLRAFWGPGTKPVGGLPESTCYPRPGPVPIVVGGAGDRTLRIAARLADGCNVNVAPAALDAKLQALHGFLAEAGRSPDDFEVSVLDLPIVGTDADDVARLVERLRGRQPALTFTARRPAGVAGQHVARYSSLADRGVDTIFVALAQLAGADDLERFAPILRAFR